LDTTVEIDLTLPNGRQQIDSADLERMGRLKLVAGDMITISPLTFWVDGIFTIVNSKEVSHGYTRTF
jgi:hypothetical protein